MKKNLNKSNKQFILLFSCSTILVCLLMFTALVKMDNDVKLADYNAIKVFVSKGSHPKYTDIGTTVTVQP